MILRQPNIDLFAWLLVILNKKHQGKMKYNMQFAETKIMGKFNVGAKVCDEINKEKWNKREVTSGETHPANMQLVKTKGLRNYCP